MSGATVAVSVAESVLEFCVDVSVVVVRSV
jgi:hypothetical protein